MRGGRLPNFWCLFPPLRGGIGLLSAPSSYLLVIGLLLTIWAKLTVWNGLGAPWSALGWISAIDVVVHMAFAACFAIGEARSRYLLFVTVPLSLLVSGIAILNAAYLSRAGEQLTWEALVLATERIEDLGNIISERAGHVPGYMWGLGVAALILVPALAARWVRPTKEQARSVHYKRAHFAAVLVCLGLVLRGIFPTPEALSEQRLGTNATVSTYWQWIQDTPERSSSRPEFQGYAPQELVEAAAIAAFAQTKRPNILLVVLESTRYDYTSLAGAAAHAHTPSLMAIADRGTIVRTTRAVLPHTTKSLFSILCGRLPLMQRAILEVSVTIPVQCLPQILAQAGYVTAFFQSALGSFENRPRLVAKFGYEHFEAWEDLQGQPLGYLASEEDSLVAPVSYWLEGTDPARPFFATILTSATHDPYRLPDTLKRLEKESGPSLSPQQRYTRLIEAQDAMLGNIFALLSTKNIMDNTIVVVVGDHGEGFGDKGIRQHDNNFYEEGLRVPWVMAGPNIAKQTITGNASLTDVTPTLLEILGIPMAHGTKGRLDGVSVLQPSNLKRPRWFSCWYDFRCRGFVLGNQKVVHIPQTGRTFLFDLSADPEERTPLPLPAVLKKMEVLMHETIEAQRTRTWPFAVEKERLFDQWECPENRPCKHPESPVGLFATER